MKGLFAVTSEQSRASCSGTALCFWGLTKHSYFWIRNRFFYWQWYSHDISCLFKLLLSYGMTFDVVFRFWAISIWINTSSGAHSPLRPLLLSTEYTYQRKYNVRCNTAEKSDRYGRLAQVKTRGNGATVCYYLVVPFFIDEDVVI